MDRFSRCCGLALSHRLVLYIHVVLTTFPPWTELSKKNYHDYDYYYVRLILNCLSVWLNLRYWSFISSLIGPKCVSHHSLHVKCCSPWQIHLHKLLNMASGNNIHSNSSNTYITQTGYWCRSQYVPPFPNQSIWQITFAARKLLCATNGHRIHQRAWMESKLKSVLYISMLYL